MGNNKLKLNPDQTEFIVIGYDQIRSSLKSSFPVSLLGNTMEPAESVKNLGVILDAENSMQRHVASLCRISYYHLRELRRVRRYLNHETAVKVANALVSSRLDYCFTTQKRHILADYREFIMPYVGRCASSFIAGAPTEWKKLPKAIRTIESISGFRKQLKTYLFRLDYPPP